MNNFFSVVCSHFSFIFLCSFSLFDWILLVFILVFFSWFLSFRRTDTPLAKPIPHFVFNAHRKKKKNYRSEKKNTRRNFYYMNFNSIAILDKTLSMSKWHTHNWRCVSAILIAFIPLFGNLLVCVHLIVCGFVYARWMWIFGYVVRVRQTFILFTRNVCAHSLITHKWNLR